jgi:hypothetical protein
VVAALWSRGGGSLAGMTKPLVDEAIDQERSITTRGFCMLFYVRREAL